MSYARKREFKLEPAHVRVLDLVIQPQGMRRAGHVDCDFIMDKTHWSEATVRSLLLQARQYFGCHTTQQLVILWREKRK